MKKEFTQHHFHIKIINMFLNIKSKYKNKYNFRLSSEKGLPSTTFAIQSLNQRDDFFKNNNFNIAKNLKHGSGAGFTIVELAVVIMIIVILSGIILFSITQYVDKGKDSNISGNLVVLIPAGEVFYNGNGNSYNDGGASFCNPNQNSVIKNVISQMPAQTTGAPCYSLSMTPTTNRAGVCCYAESQAWAACAREFTNPSNAYCVDSRGIKKEITNNDCVNYISANFSCPF